MTKVKTSRPPYWSVQIPSTRRIRLPVSTGVPMSRPNWESVSPRSRFTCTPRIEKIVQTAKQTVKAAVEDHNAMERPLTAVSAARLTLIVTPPELDTEGGPCRGGGRQPLT